MVVLANAVRSRGSGFVTMSLSGFSPGEADPSEAVEALVEVWIGDGDRCRVDEGGSVRLVSGDEVVTYNESFGAVRVSEPSQSPLSVPGAVVAAPTLARRAGHHRVRPC